MEKPSALWPMVALMSLALALSSLGYTAWLHRSFETRLEDATTEALRARERALIERLKPGLKKMNEDIGTDWAADPATIEELFEPLLRIIRSIC